MRHLLAFALLLSTLPPTVPARSLRFAPASLPAPLPQETPTPAPSPTPDPVFEQAEREAKLADELKKKAVADKERAEAEAARLKALVQPLGAPANVTVPTGSVTTDAAGWVESQMLAQEAARQISSNLAYFLCRRAITPGDGDAAAAQINTLVIYNNSDLTSVELFGAVNGQLKILRGDLDEMNDLSKQALIATDPKTGTGVFKLDGTDDTGPLTLFAAPGIATGIIKSVAELINLFRTDTSFTNKAITLSEDVVVSHIVQDLTNRGFAEDKGDGKEGDGRCTGPVRVYYPALYPPKLLETSDKSELLKLLDAVEKAKNHLAGNVEKLDARVKELTKFVGMAEDLKTKEEKDLPAKKKELAEAGCNGKQKNSDKCKKLIEERDALVKAINELEAGLAEINKIEKFKDWIEQLKDLKAKAQALVTSTSLVTTKLNTPDENTKLSAVAQLLRAERLHGIMMKPGVYTLRVAVKANGTTKVKKNLFVDAKVRHSAGADLTYQLFDREGVIAQANSVQCYIEYQSARDVQGIVSGVKNGVKCKSVVAVDDSDGAGDDAKKKAKGNIGGAAGSR
ncbi:MAG: hypothetical protein LC754_00150 [Acidobacteria bacterium]|nr:hypothetical protein [Acidobacteriota bacterium]